MIKRVEIVVSTPGIAEADRRIDSLLVKKKLLGDPTAIKLTVEDNGAASKLAAVKAAEDGVTGSTEKRTRATTSEAAALLATSRMQASCNEAMGKGIAAEIGMATYADRLKDALEAVAVAEQFTSTEAGKLAGAQAETAVSAFRTALGEDAAAGGARNATTAFLMLGQAQAFVNGEQERLVATSAALRGALNSEGRGAFGATLGAAGMGARDLTALEGGGGKGGGGAGFLGGLLATFGLGGGKGGGGGRGIFGLPAVPLFGGIGAIGGLHLLAQSILEIATTLIPATVALIAFGVAGSDAARQIYTHFTDLHTVMDATGRSIAPATGALEKLHQAVAPAVFQILGDAMSVATAKAGAFSVVARGAATVMDQLAARTAVALKSGGADIFLHNAVHDLALWGTLAGNVFGIIGNVLKSMPGYATILLSVFVNLSHAIEVLTGSPVVQWALRLGLGFHGAAVYGGLLATGLMAIVPWAARLVTAFAGAGKASTAMRDLGTAASGIQKDTGKVGFLDKFKAGFADITQNTPVIIGRLKSIGAAEAEAGTKTGLLARAGNVASGAMGLLSRVPVAAWGLGVAAVIGVQLVAGLHNATFATKQWVTTLQNGLASTSIRSLLPQIHNDIGAIQDAMRGASKSFVIQPVGNQDTFAGMHFSGFVHDWQELVSVLGIGQSKFGALSAAMQQFRTQGQQVSQFVVQPLAKQFGGTANAMGLMSAAGITSKQVLDAAAAAAHGNMGPLLALEQQVYGTANALKAMGIRGGVLGNDLQVLDRQTTDSYKAIQQVNQGWDTFIGNVTGTQGSFDNFALGMKTLNSSATQVTHHLGDARVSIGGLGTAIDGLSKQDLALNQAFTQQVTNANALIDTWRQAGLAGNMFAGGVKGSVAQLLKFAKGSPEALAQLTALAQEAGFNGPASFAALSKWVGNTHDALQKMKDAANQATIQEALLSGAMRGQGNLIANQLIGDINQATLKYYGVRAAAAAYGNAVAKDGQQSDQARAARTRLINDIIASGKAAHETTGQIATMIAKVLNIPKSRAIAIVETGTGRFSITGPGGQSVAAPGGRFLKGGARAAGGLITGGEPHRDSVLSLLTPGELVVPEHLVQAGIVDHLRGRLPGFAGGGLVGGNPSIGFDFGKTAVSNDQRFVSAFTSSMESAMRSAMAAAMTAATAAFRGGAPAYGSSSAAMRFAQGLLPSYGWGGQWPALFALWERESGWNANAVNPSSGAYGIPQALGHGHPFNLGDYANQIRWGLAYIRGRYGSPNAAEGHEQAFGWYHNGLKNAVFTKPTLIGVGDGGPELVNVTPMRSRAAAYATAAGRGGDIYITVAGDSDPDGAARQIWMKLRDLKRHNGGQSLGL